MKCRRLGPAVGKYETAEKLEGEVEQVVANDPDSRESLNVGQTWIDVVAIGGCTRLGDVAAIGSQAGWSILCGCCARCLPRTTDSSTSRCSLAGYALGRLPA